MVQQDSSKIALKDITATILEKDMIKIELTKKQKKALKPLFESIVELNKQFITCAIAAQVYEDGIVAKVVTCSDIGRKVVIGDIPLFSSAAEKMESSK